MNDDPKLKGLQVYLVGGAVRDALLELPVHERDYVVVGASPEELTARGFEAVGRDFPVFLHPHSKEEYALARTERKSGPGYTGFICEFSPDVTLEDDLLRRDLTINAIAQDPDGTLIDPHHGVADIKNRVLRHVSPAFSEDPLRVLRIARFAARFHGLGFTIAADTKRLMTTMSRVGELQHLTPERVWMETYKALTTDFPAVYFDVLQQVGALSAIVHKSVESVPMRTLERTHKIKESDIVRYALAHYDLNLSVLTADKCSIDLSHWCRVPNLHHKIADSVIHISRKLQSGTLGAANILAFLHFCDAFRRPERLELTLKALTYIAQENGWSQRDDVMLLARALSITAEVDVQSVIADGHQHGAISEELDRRRLAKLKQHLGS
nr:hypothetical protein [Aliidiomarina halalkaliphila]